MWKCSHYMVKISVKPKKSNHSQPTRPNELSNKFEVLYGTSISIKSINFPTMLRWLKSWAVEGLQAAKLCLTWSTLWTTGEEKSKHITALSRKFSFLWCTCYALLFSKSPDISRLTSYFWWGKHFSWLYLHI